MRRAAVILGLILYLICLAAARLPSPANVFTPQGILLTDADCYARLQRALPVAEGRTPGLRHHTFENAPQGTTPHTTAPLDWILAGIARSLPFPRVVALELAGAFLPVVLGILAGMIVWWHARGSTGSGRWLAPLLFAASPALAFASTLGRADHHALVLFLLCAAWAAPGEPMGRPLSRVGEIVAGLCWGFALWVSLYEPLILFALTLLGRTLSRPSIWRERAFVLGLATTGVVLAIAFFVEGWRIHPIPAALRPAASAWAATIGELQPAWRHPGALFAAAGAAWLAAPFFFARRGTGADAGRAALAPALLLGATFLLTLWQLRWAPFFALAAAWTLPAQLRGLRLRGWAIPFALAILWPTLSEWDRRLDHAEGAQTRIARAELLSLRQAAAQLPPDTVFLAPWWLSPPIAWWSLGRGLAGSSHEALAGTIDAARFALSTDPDEARALLIEREVRAVVITDPQPVLQNAAALLGRDPAPDAMAARLFRSPGNPPPFLRLAWSDGRVHLFEVIGP